MRVILNPTFPSLATSNCSLGLADVISEFFSPQLETWFLQLAPESLDQSFHLRLLVIFPIQRLSKVKRLCLFPGFTDDFKKNNYLFHLQL
jgi:hypothetical protein